MLIPRNRSKEPILAALALEGFDARWLFVALGRYDKTSTDERQATTPG